MKNLLKRLLSEDRGQDVIEYALLAAAISVVAIPIVPAMGTYLGDVYTFISTQVLQIPSA
jgi:Flp pilus assembly pilin Flp